MGLASNGEPLFLGGTLLSALTAAGIRIERLPDRPVLSGQPVIRPRQPVETSVSLIAGLGGETSFFRAVRKAPHRVRQFRSGTAAHLLPQKRTRSHRISGADNEAGRGAVAQLG